MFNNNLGQGIQGIPDAFAGGVDNSVKLFIFTPRIHGNIQLRPSIFNFNPGVVDEMLNAPTAKEAVKQYGTKNSINLTKSIKPDAIGVAVDTSWFDQMWSFVLVFDDKGSPMNTRVISGPHRRSVLTGYFLDEPVAPHTLRSSRPIINPDALLIFTHESMGVITKHLAAQSRDSISITANSDYVPQLADGYVQSDDLALVDACSVTKCSIHSGDGDGSKVVIDDPALLATQNGESPVLGADCKTPRQHMMTIASAIDSAADIVGGHGQMYSSFDTGYQIVGDDPFTKFINSIHQSLSLGVAPGIHCAINAAAPIPLSILDSQFPHMIVYPMGIPTTPCYEVGNQAEVNPHNTFSSMVSSTVSAYAMDLGISGIGFRYDSFSAGTLGQRGMGNWQLMRVTSFLGDEMHQDQLFRNVNAFKHAMESDLFPVLMAFNGHFSVIVDYDMIGSTVVHLHFRDYTDPFGLYEAHNKLGGIISPAVGTTNVLHTNREQLDQLTTIASANVCGRIPISDSERMPFYNPNAQGPNIMPTFR